MASHFKLSIFSKIIPDIVGKDILHQYVRNTQISYKPGNHKYFLNLNCQTFSNDERKILLDRLCNDTDVNITNVYNTENIQFEINKNVFVKHVLEGVIAKLPLTESKAKKIVIDFSSPNIAKPFHVGHLRSTIIGNFISNINKYYNNDVVKLNYLGDWGTQFGLLQYGLKFNKVNLQDLEKDALKIMFNAYVTANKMATTSVEIQNEARKYFSDIEYGRTDLGDWNNIRKLTIKELEKTYERLNITFDSYHWESDYNGKAIKELMEFLKSQNIIKTDESGKQIAKVMDRNVTVLKSDNSTLYLSRDIAALIDRYNQFKFDDMLYVVDNSQTDHFKALIEIVKQFNKPCADSCKHIKFGRIKGMSTRSGNVVFLTDILDEAKSKMYEQQLKSKNTRSVAMNDSTCDTLGTTAVIINDLKQRRQKDYTFEWNRILQSEGDSGIKLQYLHCRLWSLEQNCGVNLPDTCDPKYLSEPLVEELVTELSRFEDVLLQSKDEHEACILVAYLFRLARHINRAFNELRVKGVDTDIAKQRLLLFHAARITVKTGLEILGVKPLYKM